MNGISDSCLAGQVAYSVARRYRLEQSDVTGRSRAPHIMRARRAWYRALRDLGWSYPRIGKATGRTHDTILRVVRTHGWCR